MSREHLILLVPIVAALIAFFTWIAKSILELGNKINEVEKDIDGVGRRRNELEKQVAELITEFGVFKERINHLDVRKLHEDLYKCILDLATLKEKLSQCEKHNLQEKICKIMLDLAAIKEKISRLEGKSEDFEKLEGEVPLIRYCLEDMHKQERS